LHPRSWGENFFEKPATRSCSYITGKEVDWVGFEPTTSAQGNFSISLSLLNVLRKLRSQKYAGQDNEYTVDLFMASVVKN
jgi:hypothetical protein